MSVKFGRRETSFGGGQSPGCDTGDGNWPVKLVGEMGSGHVFVIKVSHTHLEQT